MNMQMPGPVCSFLEWLDGEETTLARLCPAAPGPTPPQGSGFDRTAAAVYAREHAAKDFKSALARDGGSYCARYVMAAIAFGFGAVTRNAPVLHAPQSLSCIIKTRIRASDPVLNNTQLVAQAKTYGPVLERLGFKRLAGQKVDKGFVAQKADIIVLQPPPPPHNQFGHIEMYDGAGWVSNFKQRTPWPWAKATYTLLTYAVYRAPL
jgi:hypothetical protein